MNASKHGFTLVELVVVIVILGVLVGVLMPAVSCRRPHRYWAAAKLYPIQNAISAYCADHGSMPPRVVFDKQGRPMHSWRALILPYLGITDYRMEEPWNSKHNLMVVNESPDLQLYSTDEPGKTSVLALYGENTVWSTKNRERFAEHLVNSNDVAPAIFLVVSENHQVRWSEPEDLHLDQVSELLVRPPRTNQHDWNDGFFTQRYYGRCFVMAYGFSGRFDRVDSELFRRMSQMPTAEQAWLEYGGDSGMRLDETRIRFDNIFCLLVFLLISVLPSLWGRADTKA